MFSCPEQIVLASTLPTYLPYPESLSFGCCAQHGQDEEATVFRHCCLRLTFMVSSPLCWDCQHQLASSGGSAGMGLTSPLPHHPGHQVSIVGLPQLQQSQPVAHALQNALNF